MKLIVGLGIPGLKLESTIHNLGFKILDAFFKDNSSVKESFKEEKKFQSEMSEISLKSKNGQLQKAILVKPLTYMNNSGLAVKKIADFYKIDTSNILVVHDEIDLPLGGMKIRLGGSSAGHKGVESIIEHLKSEKFWRFRIGIGKQVQKDKISGKKLKKIGIGKSYICFAKEMLCGIALVNRHEHLVAGTMQWF
mgnify:CR=1 FL=1